MYVPMVDDKVYLVYVGTKFLLLQYNKAFKTDSIVIEVRLL